MNTDALALLLIFLEYILFFGMITMMKNLNAFQIVKVQS